MSTPLHLAAAHPARATPLLNDVLNFAIHLEKMWEEKVKEEALKSCEIDGSPLRKLPPQAVSWGRIVASGLDVLAESLINWKRIKWRKIVPALNAVVSAALPINACKEWATAYRLIMTDLASAAAT